MVFTEGSNSFLIKIYYFLYNLINKGNIMVKIFRQDAQRGFNKIISGSNIDKNRVE